MALVSLFWIIGQRPFASLKCIWQWNSIPFEGADMPNLPSMVPLNWEKLIVMLNFSLFRFKHLAQASSRGGGCDNHRDTAGMFWPGAEYSGRLWYSSGVCGHTGGLPRRGGGKRWKAASWRPATRGMSINYFKVTIWFPIREKGTNVLWK